MTESQAVTKLVSELRTHGHFWKATDRFRAGVPDIVGCVDGRFIGIEAKIDYNKPSEIQAYTLLDIAKNGGYAVVVTYSNKSKRWWIGDTGYDFRDVVAYILEKAADDVQV